MSLLTMAKSLAYAMPPGVQLGLKNSVRSYQILRGKFRSPEPEWDRLAEWIKPGDTVLDIGANAGHYTLRMSELVGPNGLVIAFEPIAETFRELSYDCGQARYKNIALVNAAVSDRPGRVRMTVPTRDSYRASVTDSGDAVLAITIDAMKLPKVDLIKIDVEGHELQALLGARELLERDKPLLVVEENDRRDTRVGTFLSEFGYRPQVADRSPNTVYSA
jgi:FkbM family methyltransferase